MIFDRILERATVTAAWPGAHCDPGPVVRVTATREMAGAYLGTVTSLGWVTRAGPGRVRY